MRDNNLQFNDGETHHGARTFITNYCVFSSEARNIRLLVVIPIKVVTNYFKLGVNKIVANF